MLMCPANRRASATSARGTLALSAVTATARSPRARKAALATTVLSMPPLKATATPSAHARKTARRRSAFAAVSDGTAVMRGPAGGEYRQYIAPGDGLPLGAGGPLGPRASCPQR